MKNQKIIFSVLLGTHLLLAQKDIVKNDFAFGRELSIPAEKSVIDVIIPEDVYLTSKQAYLGDLGVFNAKGELVPHVLLQPDVKTFEKVKESRVLALFPIYSSNAEGENQFSQIKITTSSEGTITEVKHESSDNNKQVDGKKLVGYLVDASNVKDPIAVFQMNLDKVEDNVFINFVIEGSQDLNTWTLLDSSSILARFELSDERIIKDKIEINGGRYNYYRLSWKNAGLEIKMNSVTVPFSNEIEKIEKPIQWQAAQSFRQVSVGGAPLVNQYDLGGSFPISQLRVKFADRNSVARLIVRYASSESGPWSTIQEETFYTIVRDGATVDRLVAKIYAPSSRYWQLGLLSNKSGIGNQFPEIEFGWRPQMIRFLARGEAPFTLAYGSSKTVNFQSADLLNNDWTKGAAEATVGDRTTIGGDKQLIVEANNEMPWKKITLWAVLILGVLMLGSMAYQLKKKN